jgi:hypothetical protein
MYQDDVLREVWRAKDKLAAEYARDPDAYWANLRRLAEAWKKRTAKSPRGVLRKISVRKNAPVRN